MPYDRFTRKEKGKTRWCARNKQTGKVVCYSSKAKRERGLGIRESFAKRGTREMENKVIREAVWTRRFINDLPDSAFLYIMPGGKKDSEGKTKPRNLRKFPYKNKQGKIDLPHLRNAIARIPQAHGISAATKKRLQARARGLLERAQ